jgi:hypothetical protein
LIRQLVAGNAVMSIADAVASNIAELAKEWSV